MMVGEYPCCGAPLCIELPEETPAYAPEDCPACGAKVWHRFSRVNPMSWKEDDFLAEYIVDGFSRTIEERNPPPPMSAMEKAVSEACTAAYWKAWEDMILYGTGYAPLPSGIIGTSMTSVITDEIVAFNRDLGHRMQSFSIGPTVILVDGATILDSGAPLEPDWPSFAGSMEIHCGEMTLALERLITKIERAPASPPHYSDLNSVSRNARRGRKRRRKCK
jgi:hypothetical protein